MKNILLIGASSAAAKSLFEMYSTEYNFIRLSRNDNESDINNFNVLDSETYYISDLRYDGLVYFPGTINLKKFNTISVEDFYNDYDINVMGLIKVLKFYMPYFNEGSSFVFVSSLAAKMGMPFHSSVAMVKSAIIGLCKSLAAEFAPKFRVNCISPSLFESKMSARFLRNDNAKERIRNSNPLNMIGSSEDISSLINFLLSPGSKWITGQNISVDGGMSTIKL